MYVATKFNVRYFFPPVPFGSSFHYMLCMRIRRYAAIQPLVSKIITRKKKQVETLSTSEDKKVLTDIGNFLSEMIYDSLQSAIKLVQLVV